VGAELIGLGRSIYAVFDRQLVAHALEACSSGCSAVRHPSAQFVTSTRGGQLLRVQMAPVRAIDASERGQPVLNGFVLMLDNITRDFADESERDRCCTADRGSRASLGNLQAAVELLDDPDARRGHARALPGRHARRGRGDEPRIQELAQHTTQTLKTRWPLEDMLGADLVAAARAAHRTLCGCRTVATDVDAALWLKVDSFSCCRRWPTWPGGWSTSTASSWCSCACRCRPRAQLDLVWIGQAMSTETVMGWETDAIKRRRRDQRADGARRGAAPRRRLLVRARAGAPRGLLPLPAAAGGRRRASSRPARCCAATAGPSTTTSTSSRHASVAALADRKLAELAYTVFDTETTGLQPSEGDEIIQIGATRIVAGKLRRQECFEQLVDPQRDIPAPASRSTASRPRWWPGSRPSTQVLPAFHAFAQDTVLVAHNAAFDMRFLQLKQQPPACASSSRCSTRCCCRPWSTRSRSRTAWRPSPSGWASPSWAATPRWATRWSPPRSS
jgi:DNA polymerase-3 subunit epsilon